MTTTSNKQNSVFVNVPATPDTTYEFNLPPHAWSLPLAPINTEVLPGKTRTGVINNGPGTGDINRRGKIWRASPLTPFIDPTTTAASLNNILNPNILDKKSFAYKNYIETQKKLIEARKKEQDRLNKNYGFQFVWNPTEYSTSVQVSQNVVPATTDALAFLNLFQGTGTVNFNLQINRINDFACFKSLPTSNFLRFYGSHYNSPGAATVQLMISDLKKRGTLADIEYLYKTINGGSIKNSAGVDTSDIGIIVPTLVKVDIGPYSQLGIVNNISVGHKMFTQGMIPILSEVTIGIQILSSYGFGNQLSQNIVTGAPDGVKNPGPRPIRANPPRNFAAGGNP